MKVGFARCSSSALAALALLAGGCVEEKPGITGTTSLRVEVTSPTDLGSADNRLPDTERTITMDITALDAQGLEDPSLTGPLDVYVHFLGGLTPELGGGDPPYATIQMTAGHADGVSVTLPATYGPTFLWIEDATSDPPTYATGTTDTIWYHDAYIADIQRVDETAFDALYHSPLEGKQALVTGSRYGTDGRLVVTGSYSQGYTVSDVQCSAGGTPPCTTGDYDAVFVFSFNRPSDEQGRTIDVGHVLSELRGGVSEFLGQTEIGFPQGFLATDGNGNPIRNTNLVPPPTVLQSSWLTGSQVTLERYEGALVEIDDGDLCPLDQDWDDYQQWKLDIGQGCALAINVLSAGQVTSFDPTSYVGQTIPRVVGTLRPLNFDGGGSVWLVYPRDSADITSP